MRKFYLRGRCDSESNEAISVNLYILSSLDIKMTSSRCMKTDAFWMRTEQIHRWKHESSKKIRPTHLLTYSPTHQTIASIAFNLSHSLLLKPNHIPPSVHLVCKRSRWGCDSTHAWTKEKSGFSSHFSIRNRLHICNWTNWQEWLVLLLNVFHAFSWKPDASP